MARVLEVREICERALRKIGSYSIRDSGADAAEFEEARRWLDMVVGHVAARRRTWWLVEETAQVTLTDDVWNYSLTNVLPGGDPIAHVVGVYAVDTTSYVREPVEILRRDQWEERERTFSNPPTSCYIDRGREPRIQIRPIPVAPVTHRLDIVFQRTSPDLTAGSSTEKMSQFREAWNLYLVTALAAQIGNGPVRKLPADEVRDMQAEANRLLFDLECYDGHEMAPGRVAYNDF